LKKIRLDRILGRRFALLDPVIERAPSVTSARIAPAAFPGRPVAAPFHRNGSDGGLSGSVEGADGRGV